MRLGRRRACRRMITLVEEESSKIQRVLLSSRMVSLSAVVLCEITHAI